MKRGIWIKITSYMREERGLAFMSTLVVSAVLGLAALAFLITSSNDARMISTQIKSAQALYNAESAVQWGEFQLAQNQGVNWRTDPPWAASSALPKFPLGDAAKPDVKFEYSDATYRGTLTVTGKDEKGINRRKIQLQVSNPVAKNKISGDDNTPLSPGYAFKYALCACNSDVTDTNGGLQVGGSSDSYQSMKGNYDTHSNIGSGGNVGSNGNVLLKGNSMSGSVHLLGNFTNKGGSTNIYGGDIIGKGYFHDNSGIKVHKTARGGGKVSVMGAYGPSTNGNAYNDGNGTVVDVSVNVGKAYPVPNYSGTVSGKKKGGCVNNTFVYSTDYVCPCAQQLDLDKAIARAKASNKNWDNIDHSLLQNDANGQPFSLVVSKDFQLLPGIYYFTSMSTDGSTHTITLADNTKDVVIYLDDTLYGNGLKLAGSDAGGGNIINNVSSIDNLNNGIKFNLDKDNNGNQTGHASNFRIYTNTTKDITYNSNSKYVGIIYAPKANMTCNGDAELYGSFVGYNVKATGNFTAHYDGSSQNMMDLPKQGTGYKDTPNPMYYVQVDNWKEVPLN